MLRVYLATKLFSFFDRVVSVRMYNAVLASDFFQNSQIYLPFKDSNMKVNQDKNIAYNIFIADIESLSHTNYLICRLDGLSFDAGIGLEIGYCFAKGIPSCIFTTDYVKTKINDRKFNITPIANKICSCYRYDYYYEPSLTYEDELEYNAKRFSLFVRNSLENGVANRCDLSKIVNESRAEYDVFIDICGCQYEWNELVIQKLCAFFREKNISFYISRRYIDDYNHEEDILSLVKSRMIIACFDENEPNFDTSILLGIAYALNKYIIGYESNQVVYYVEGKQEMGVNLMLEQACNKIASSFSALFDILSQYEW